MWRAGMIGNLKDYEIGYANYIQLHGLRDTILGLMLGKKHKSKPPIPFHEMFKTIDDYMFLGQGSQLRQEKAVNSQILAKKAVAIFGGSSENGPPTWLKDALND